ncbi:MAG TPA: aminoacyl-histidine dipeptidase [Flavobacteriia bacterium]|nr:aminoacyl-histidine dipeptidase [Flavobacteriia bacterium]
MSNQENNAIQNIEPKEIWKNFAKLNSIPRPSKKEERIREFMVNFGKNLGLETVLDSVGNVIIKKPASKGMEDRKTVVLQGHLDMVCQKNNDTDFDFDTQGIQMYIDGDWVKAKGTTLGADNGLGVSAIMGILESRDIAHPPIEALFTIDEETGMTGAIGLQAGYLDGEILLNLDTEDDDEIGVGCAGGIDITGTQKYAIQYVHKDAKAFKITVKGLQGGHSGMDIHKGFGNANKLMNRILYAIQKDMLISEIKGGSLRNAIPRESNAIIITENIEAVKEKFTKISNDIIDEYLTIEKDIEIKIVETEVPKTRMPKDIQEMLLRVVYGIPNGVFRMSPDIEDLVETSNNLARIVLENGTIEIACLTRSSVESGKMDLAYQIKSIFELGKFDVEYSGSYPGWKPNPNSEIVKLLENIYKDKFKEEPKILACHAGLECGILGTNYPEMDMVSFGPNIRGAHSPDEKASISSTKKFWNYLLDVLKNIPKKQG